MRKGVLHFISELGEPSSPRTLTAGFCGGLQVWGKRESAHVLPEQAAQTLCSARGWGGGGGASVWWGGGGQGAAPPYQGPRGNTLGPVAR